MTGGGIANLVIRLRIAENKFRVTAASAIRWCRKHVGKRSRVLIQRELSRLTKYRPTAFQPRQLPNRLRLIFEADGQAG